MLQHPFAPVFDNHCTTLILGSFPSVKSRENAFYYGHPQNRFWRVLAALAQNPVPVSVPEKKRFLLAHRIALWDVFASCEITGSSDASIKNAIPNDLTEVICNAPVSRIFTNGQTAHRCYEKYLLPATGIPDLPLPSTSPANASWSMERLISAWTAVLPPVSFSERVYAATRQIPPGCVATYAQLAAYIGAPGAARAVGNALHCNPNPDYTPCFRVVNAKGELAEHFGFGGAAEQRRRLEQDGISVSDNRVDLSLYFWQTE